MFSAAIAIGVFSVALTADSNAVKGAPMITSTPPKFSLSITNSAKFFNVLAASLCVLFIFQFPAIIVFLILCLPNIILLFF